MLRYELAAGVQLRLLEPDHAEEMFAAVERNRERLRRWLWWVDHTKSADDVRAFARQAAEQLARGEGPHFAICVDGLPAGGIGSHSIDWRNRSTSLGYWIDAAHEGRGIVTRACKVYLNYLFAELRLHRVEIRCSPDNARSAAIPRRFGFTLEGTLRESALIGGRWEDMLVFSMLDREWLARV